MTHDPYEQPGPQERPQASAPQGWNPVEPPAADSATAYTAPPPTRSPWADPGTSYTAQPYGGSPYGGSYGAPSYAGPAYGGPSYGDQPYGVPWVSQPYPQYGSSPYAGQYGARPYATQPYANHPGYYDRPADRPARTRKGLLAGLLSVVVAAALVIAGVAFSTSGRTSIAGSGSAAQFPQALDPNGAGNGAGNGGAGSAPSGNGGSLPNGGSGSGANTAATARQKVGVVTIVSTLTYQQAESAGTGTILSSDGLILTNNHVVNGATSITVTVESTDRSYKADVVGTAPTKDIAVLKLRNASGLSTANFANSSSRVSVGDAVVGVGNAGGTGTLTAASGKVVALNQSITATDENGQDAETLHQLIEVNAPIISGDSGGPLYDADGKVVGIDTAASASSRHSGAGASTAYAITIDNAMSVARQIESGVRTTTIHIGLPGFLGVSTAPSAGAQSGVAVQSVVPNGPADQAGITRGSTITTVDGSAVASPTALRSTLSAKRPGTKVRIGWTDATGAAHTATVALATGPAD